MCLGCRGRGPRGARSVPLCGSGAPTSPPPAEQTAGFGRILGFPGQAEEGHTADGPGAGGLGGRGSPQGLPVGPDLDVSSRRRGVPSRDTAALHRAWDSCGRAPRTQDPGPSASPSSEASPTRVRTDQGLQRSPSVREAPVWGCSGGRRTWAHKHGLRHAGLLVPRLQHAHLPPPRPPRAKATPAGLSPRPGAAAVP